MPHERLSKADLRGPDLHARFPGARFAILEYFDATLIGLTATPSKQTFAFFDKNLVSEYRHEHAVRDRVNVPYEVYEIRTRITQDGAQLAADTTNPRVAKRGQRAAPASQF